MQQQVHSHPLHLRVPKDKVSVSEMQEYESEAGNHAVSGQNFEEELNIMECPHCHKEIIGKPCPVCGTNVPTESRYCMECGAPIKEEAPQTTDQDDPFDLDDRVLCPDGTCTGIIVDGKCTECGKLYRETEKS
jgi:hypothetical protein